MRLDIRGAYPENWREISNDVKRAAGYRCVRCLHPFTPKGNPLSCDERCDRMRGRIVSPLVVGERPHDFITPGLNYGVHHLDGDKSNCRWWNLLALCNSCHLTIQARVVPERAWLLEHSDWMKPYVAGFYAWWFARSEPTRELVDSSLDLWLAVGQPWLYPDLADVANAIIRVGQEASYWVEVRLEQTKRPTISEDTADRFAPRVANDNHETAHGE